MSVNINVITKELTIHDRWALVKNGDYVIAGWNDPPIPDGLYRVFFSTPSENEKVIVLCPMFPIPNDDGSYPFITPFNDKVNLPHLHKIVSKININVEVSI